ncbi:M48 family metallopeptidase [Mangrovibacterium marinum]|uniref:Tetratricopeptide repeat protein n=1 Tax=Mangrovibacterium marinum TaxID=1639118 RepID=A0A2T5C1Z1_9BACT|nr:tetratricopeptide repeat protein [Mangrovibacterium marinum]PTN08686.1 hypothetical protein C8N47_10741 [Mangrovibacterium marinum]
MPFILFKNRRLNKATYALNSGKYQQALKLAQPLVNSRNNEIAYRANFIGGLALYKRKKYDDSLPFLEKACQLGNYRHDWYNLAMASVFAGKLTEADEAFKNIYRTNVQPGYVYAVPVPGLLFQYMKALKRNQFIDAAITRANELKQMYVGVGSDTTKQVQRGLPAYPAFRVEVESLFHPEKFIVWEKDVKG